MVLARKSIKQRFTPSPGTLALMEDFRKMTNDCVRIGLTERSQAPSLKRLSLLAYRELRDRYDDVPSYYRLCAISKTAGILAARKKSIKRGFHTRRPYISKPLLVSCYGFKIEDDSLLIPIGDRRFEKIKLNGHTLAIISQPDIQVRSFTLTDHSLSLCIAKQVKKKEDKLPTVDGVIGIDRNLRNITVGNAERVTYYDVSKIIKMNANTRDIIRSFKRDDVRIRKKIAEKYGRRRKERTRQILHRVSKDIVSNAKENGLAIVFEDIKGIRKLYRKGNGQGRSFRARMNSAPWFELKRQVEYKGAWDEVPVLTLTASETRGTTMDCPRCGERLQLASKNDGEHWRQLWCKYCKRWGDRDFIAVLNISRRGWVRFAQSKGEASEAMKGNPKKEGSSREPVILRVDASKSSLDGCAIKHAQTT